MLLLLISEPPLVVWCAPTSFFLFSGHNKAIMVSESSHSPSYRTFLTDKLRPQVDVNLVHLVGCHRTFLIIEDEHNPCALGCASCESYLTFRIAHSKWLVKDCGNFHGVFGLGLYYLNIESIFCFSSFGVI